MKTSFTKTFVAVTVVLLLSLLSVGVFLRTMLRDYLDESSYEQLEQDASAIAKLITENSTHGVLPEEAFAKNLNMLSMVSEADTLVCDPSGQIRLCSEGRMDCSHVGKTVNMAVLHQVRTNGTARDVRLIDGLYDDARYVCAASIYSEGKLTGYVIISTPVAASMDVLEEMTDIYVLLAVLVVILAVLVVSILVYRQTKPLQRMAKTAREFGQGDLSARVPIRDGYTYEVGQMAMAFNNMAAAIEQSELQRQEFVANVSHELKTPMTTIGGYVDGVLDGTIPAEKAGQYLQVVSDETKRLSRLVRSMLDISRLQDAPIPQESRSRFDLSEVAGRVLISFEQKINDKHLQVEVTMPEDPLYSHGNPDYITQVVYNLLDNAVKFSPEGGVLGLSLREMKNKIYVSVYNDGKTIPAEELPLVFDRFHKADKSRSENRDSWGLGLHIAKTIVMSHGEEISVTSLAGRTEFTFTMPLAD